MARRDEAQTVQVGLRVKEPLRVLLEESARERGISMNAEIVRRLEGTFEPPEHKIDLEELREDISHASVRLMAIIADLHKQPQSSETARDLMDIFIRLGGILAFTYPSSDKEWGDLQQHLSELLGQSAARAQAAKEQDK
jgi:hypothetical protein